MTVKFREVGNSITVTIPKQIVTKFGLEQGMEADVVEQDGFIETWYQVPLRKCYRDMVPGTFKGTEKKPFA